jgi:hypothetical protein
MSKSVEEITSEEIELRQSEGLGSENCHIGVSNGGDFEESNLLRFDAVYSDLDVTKQHMNVVSVSLESLHSGHSTAANSTYVRHRHNTVEMNDTTWFTYCNWQMFSCKYCNLLLHIQSCSMLL